MMAVVNECEECGAYWYPSEGHCCYEAKQIKEKDKKGEQKKTDEKPEPTLLDEDIKKLLVITDDLLGELPEEVINKFAQSDDFKLYSKVLSKYKIK